MRYILVSAMLQSQQCRLPLLHEPVDFKKIVSENRFANKFIAHCIEEERRQLSYAGNHQSSLILIGPEGDFTPKEIALALENNFQPVSLGPTRLRTETAGMVAATLLCIG
jgi:16S rRNA (uracil1498-N3)-methyltransferase